MCGAQNDVAVSELRQAGPICFLVVPARVFISAYNRYGYFNFGKDLMMLTVWKVFQYTAL